MADIKPFFRGDTKKYKLVVTHDGLPVSIDGGTLTATFKSDKSLLDSEAEIQVSATGVEADPAHPTGMIHLVLSHTDTDVAPGSYYYDFQYVSASGEVTTILPQQGDSGKVRIKEDITRTV